MFDRVRRVIAVLIAVGLAAGVYLAWPRDGDDSDDGVTLSSTTTTAVTVSTTTTTLAGTTTTTGATSHVVTTVEEAEEILRDFWLGWFLGIYEQDEGLVRSVVILEKQIDAAKQQFGVMEFTAAPVRDELNFSETDVLVSNEECVAIWAVTEASFREGESSGVTVFRRVDDSWKMLSSWSLKGDRWEADCDASLSS